MTKLTPGDRVRHYDVTATVLVIQPYSNDPYKNDQLVSKHQHLIRTLMDMRCFIPSGYSLFDTKSTLRKGLKYGFNLGPDCFQRILPGESDYYPRFVDGWEAPDGN